MNAPPSVFSERPGAVERVKRLVSAARRIADPVDPLGIEARSVLPASTGLSPEGVALGLEQCLEAHPSDEEIEALIAATAEAPRAHVLLGAHVFVAAHRAIALGLAASEKVFVRPSRRELEMTRLLALGAPGLFSVVAGSLTPAAGDHAFVYGADETIAAVRGQFGPEVILHAHGAGIGVVVVDVPHTPRPALADVAAGIVEDVVPFDQRGCLSPRLVLAHGASLDPERARTLVEELAGALERAGKRVPRGTLGMEEAGAVVRYRETIRYAGEILETGAGLVGYVSSTPQGGSVVVPPVGRHLHVMATTELARHLEALSGKVVTVTAVGSPEFGQRVFSHCPGARAAPLGRMQRPPFDGPVDRRLSPR